MPHELRKLNSLTVPVMGLLDIFKTYEHEINEVRQYLMWERRMRKEYADPFIAAYGKQLGKLVDKGRKMAVQFNTSTATGSQLNKEFAVHGVRYSVLSQAHRAYFSDLRSGRYVNTAVEVAIWGILLVEDPYLVDSVKPGFSNFVRNNYKEKVPAAGNVFDHGDHEYVQIPNNLKPEISVVKPRQTVEQILTPKEEIVQITEIESKYIRKYDYFLSAIVEKALKTKTTSVAEKFAITLWPDNPTRKLGVKAGRKLGLDPREAAVLTALTSGRIHQRTNRGSSELGVKEAIEMHSVIEEFLSADESCLKTTDLPRRFHDIFLEDF